jgi:glutamyl-tRNA synthetase
MNGEYIRRLDDHDFIEHAKPFFEAAGWGVEVTQERGAAWWEMLARLTRERLKTLAELPDRVTFLFQDLEPDEAARAKALADPAASGWLTKAADALEGLAHFHAADIEAELRALPDGLGAKPKAVFAAVRAAITGSLVSPPLFESIELLGRHDAVARLRKVAG